MGMTLKEFNRLFDILSREVEDGQTHLHKDTGEPLDLYKPNPDKLGHAIFSRSIRSFQIWHSCDCTICVKNIQLIKVVDPVSEDDLWE